MSSRFYTIKTATKQSVIQRKRINYTTKTFSKCFQTSHRDFCILDLLFHLDFNGQHRVWLGPCFPTRPLVTSNTMQYRLVPFAKLEAFYQTAAYEISYSSAIGLERLKKHFMAAFHRKLSLFLSRQRLEVSKQFFQDLTLTKNVNIYF